MKQDETPEQRLARWRRLDADRGVLAQGQSVKLPAHVLRQIGAVATADIRERMKSG